MCQIANRTWRLKRPMTAYKHAPFGDRSRYKPYQRSTVNGYRGHGKVLRYENGRTTKSPSGPGIMAYIKKPRFRLHEYLIIRIPVGAVIRRGLDGGKKMVAASRVVTVGRMAER